MARPPRPGPGLADDRRRTPAPSSSTAACSTGRWTATGVRSGIEGIGLSDYGYNDTELGFDIGVDALRLSALARSLEDARDSTGARVHRYFFAHRLGVRLGDRLRLGLWETTVLAGADREFDGRYRNPLSLLLLANQYGLGADGNVLFGARRGVSHRQGHHGRGAGRHRRPPVREHRRRRTAIPTAGRSPSPRTDRSAPASPGAALYTQASSLAFRTLDPFENLTDGGVGLGRNFADMDRFTLTVSVPAGTRWLVTPELTLQRQGEGDINDPFPPDGGGSGRSCPQLFIGTVERTWRAAVALSGRQGPLDLRASGRIPSRRQCRAMSPAYRQPLRGPASGDAGPEPPGSDRVTHPPPLSRDRLLHLIQRMKESRVVVVGDIMIDRYLFGDTERLSPEAPVPVVTVRAGRRSWAARPTSPPTSPRMGARCLLVGTVGDDGDGAAIRQELAVARLDGRHVVTVAGRPTTSKTRIIARSQQIVRIDDEVDALLDGADLDRLVAAARDALADADALLLEDYNKGALAPRTDRGGHGDGSPARDPGGGGSQVPAVLRVRRGHRVQAQPPGAGVGARRGGGSPEPERPARSAGPAQGGQSAGDAGRGGDAAGDEGRELDPDTRASRGRSTTSRAPATR